MKSISPHIFLYIIGFSQVASFSSLIPLLAIYAKEEIGVTLSEVGLFVSLFFFSSAVSKLPLGAIAGGRLTLYAFLIGFVVYAVCPSVYTFLNFFPYLLVCRLVHGVAFTTVAAISQTFIALSVPTIERDEKIGFYLAFIGVGFLLGPLVSTVGVALFGVRQSFHLASLFAFLPRLCLHHR